MKLNPRPVVKPKPIFDNLSPQQKGILALKAMQEQTGMSNEDIAKALNYRGNSGFNSLKRLSAIDFLEPTDIKDAFDTVISFSKGESVGEVKPNAKTVLTAATEIIKIGTDHKDDKDKPTGNITLNLNILRGLDPKHIAVSSLDDRLIADIDDSVPVNDMCKNDILGLNKQGSNIGGKIDDNFIEVNQSENLRESDS